MSELKTTNETYHLNENNDYKTNENENTQVEFIAPDVPKSFVSKYCSMITLGVFVLIALLLIGLASYYITTLPRISNNIKPVPKNEFLYYINIDNIVPSTDIPEDQNEDKIKKENDARLAYIIDRLPILKEHFLTYVILDSKTIFNKDNILKYKEKIDSLIQSAHKIGVSISVGITEPQSNDPNYMDVIASFDFVGVCVLEYNEDLNFDNLKPESNYVNITKLKLYQFPRSFNLQKKYDYSYIDERLYKTAISFIFISDYSTLLNLGINDIKTPQKPLMIFPTCTNVLEECWERTIFLSHVSDVISINDLVDLDSLKDTENTTTKILNLANELRIFKMDYPDVWDREIGTSISLRNNKCQVTNEYIKCCENKNYQSLLKNTDYLCLIINKNENVPKLNLFENNDQLLIKVLWSYNHKDSITNKLNKQDYKVKSDGNQFPQQSAMIYAIYSKDYQAPDSITDFPSFQS